MNKKYEIKRLARMVIANHFPELSVCKIQYVFVADKSVEYLMAIKQFQKRTHLYINDVMLKCPRGAIIGCLAHEFAHMVIDIELSFFRLLSPLNATRDERQAEMLVINRGLGERLLQFHKEHEKKFKRYNKTEGLTEKEIRRAIRNLK